MATLQVIIRSVQPGEEIVYDQTITYTHPSEIPALYNQHSSLANPNGSYIIFGEIPEIYDNPEVNLYAIGIHSGMTFHVTLIGELVGRLERQALNGDINSFYKDQNTVTFKILGKQGYHLDGYAPYVEKPTFYIQDPQGKWRVGVMYKQKVYVPQPTNVVYDIIADDPKEGETYYISFINGIVEAKLPGYQTCHIIPLNIPAKNLKDYLSNHSNCDAPIYEQDFSIAAVTTIETPTKIGGRVFPINEQEVLEVLEIINTDPAYAAVVGKYINPFDYGTVAAPRTFSGSVKLTLDVNVPEAIADNTKQFLAGVLILKSVVDKCLADYAIGDLTTVRSEFIGSKGEYPQLTSRYMNKSSFQEIIDKAIVYKEFYLLPAEMIIKGDSGRFKYEPISYDLANNGKVSPGLNQLTVSIDLGYTTEFALRNCNLRTWPETEEEYATIKAGFQASGINTAKWVNVFDTTDLTMSSSGSVKNYTWLGAPDLDGTEYLGAGFVVDKEAFDKFSAGGYDNLFIGTKKTNIASNPHNFGGQYFGKNGVVIGDKYYFGLSDMIKPFLAQYGTDAVVFKVNYGDPTGLKYVENEAGITLTMVSPT